MFESELIERFSRVHPASPFVLYVPLLVWLSLRSFERGLGFGPFVGLVAAGFVGWTLLEYVLHRYVFHWSGSSYFAKRFHFILHGVHHDYPNDGDRLVMPLGASIPMAVIFYLLQWVTIGVTIGEPLYVGIGVGYLLYDGTHYAVHHFKIKNSVWKAIKHHHMLHHHADHDGGFGVSSPIWDMVFGSMPRVSQLKKTLENA